MFLRMSNQHLVIILPNSHHPISNMLTHFILILYFHFVLIHPLGEISEIHSKQCAFIVFFELWHSYFLKYVISLYFLLFKMCGKLLILYILFLLTSLKYISTKLLQKLTCGIIYMCKLGIVTTTITYCLYWINFYVWLIKYMRLINKLNNDFQTCEDQHESKIKLIEWKCWCC